MDTLWNIAMGSLTAMITLTLVAWGVESKYPRLYKVLEFIACAIGAVSVALAVLIFLLTLY